VSQHCAKVTTSSWCNNFVGGIWYIGLQGTKSSKKKKQAKLKRVMATVKKQAKKENANPHDSFAAVQLLNDPQVCHLLTHFRVVCHHFWVLWPCHLLWQMLRPPGSTFSLPTC